MNLLRIFQQRSKYFYFFMVFMGGINSILYSGILMFINDLISGQPNPLIKQYDWQLFLAMITLSVIVTKIFQTYMIRLTNQILLDFELSLFEKLRKASFQSFEKMGSQNVYTALNDTKVLAQIPETLVNLFNSAVIVVCATIYLFWISWQGGLGVICVMVGLLLFYLFRSRRIEKDLNRLRDIQNDFYKYVRDLLLGFKEIKMSTARNENIYHKFISRNRQEGRELSVSTSVRFMNNELMGNYSWYLVLGVILFLLPRVFQLNMQQMVAFIITILYLIGPIAGLVTFFPFYSRSKIAMERIRKFETELNETVMNDPENIDRFHFGVEFSSIRFEQVKFEYPARANHSQFVLGPLNFEIRQGETVFVIGGNGSGKSTFVNLLTGLYKPTGGRIYLNDIPITKEKYASYSNNISAIFTNNFLFDENYDGFNLGESNLELKEYISLMEMEKLISVGETVKFLNPNLSKGQQKRLAMIYALMENRQVIVLDEWAAEQDPHFRKYFYCEFLRELRDMGKTIIAITHDDRYYDQSSRIIKFEYGRIVNHEPVVF
jgi:cyclic peptide transporter